MVVLCATGTMFFIRSDVIAKDSQEEHVTRFLPLKTLFFT